MTGVRLTRKEKQQQTRAAIIDAATAQFAKFGVEGTSLEMIARHAGLTQGAIYSNFASKSELWWTVADEMSRTLDLTELLDADQSLGDALAGVGRAVWRLLQATSRTELLLAQEFDLYLMRHPRERAKYAREVRTDQRELAATLERGAAARGEPLPMDARSAGHNHRSGGLRPAAHVHARSPGRRRTALRRSLRCPRRVARYAGRPSTAKLAVRARHGTGA